MSASSASSPPPAAKQKQTAPPRFAVEDAAAERAAADKSNPKTAPDRRPSAADLFMQGLKMAAREEQRRQKPISGGQDLKRKFISASTRAYKYAAYMEAWRAKVERVGNLNYPEEARKRDINGSLILDVALNPDGSVNQIVVRRSSGHDLLDDAAIRIVRLAAPFAPFPASFAREIDILHITRTWQFLDNRDFR